MTMRDAAPGICPECGAPIAILDGPTHKYVSAPPGCWQLQGEVMTKEYSDPDYWQFHRFTVDAYFAQHPSGDDPRQIQSVAVHLLGLYLSIEQGLREDEVRRVMTVIIEHNKRNFKKLPKPSFAGAMTIADILKARDATEHGRLVKEWARQVWMAWKPSHETIRAFVRMEK